MGRTKPVRSVLRGIDLLDLLSEAPEGLRLSEMAAALDLKAPTLHNLARTLALRGLVVQRENGLYALGPGLLDLADRWRQGTRLLDAERAVRALAERAPRPIINYSVPTTDRLAVRLRMSPDRPGVVQHPTAHDNPIYSTANGLAFLAFAPQDRVMAMRRAQPFHEHGMPLWRSLEELEDALRGFRQQGYAVPPFPGQELFRVSCPVSDAEGVAVAYLGAALPVPEASEFAREGVVQAVCESAEELSRRSLGRMADASDDT